MRFSEGRAVRDRKCVGDTDSDVCHLCYPRWPEETMKTLILGGMRSGKSRLAERLTVASGLEPVYIATGRAVDDEMRERIAAHQRRRSAAWTTIEEPLALASVLAETASPQRSILVDCLTFWVTNLLTEGDGSAYAHERKRLLEVLNSLPGRLVLVSNETNMGIIPLGELTRRFCDEIGWLHQDIAERCDRVVWTIAGIPQVLKGDPL